MIDSSLSYNRSNSFQVAVCSLRRQCCLLMAEEPEASVLTARRAAQHVRLSRANDAYEHLHILTATTKPRPAPPYAGRYTVASRFRCRSYERGYIFQGLQNSSLPPRSAL
jgi:hypothetical protein